MYDSKNIAQELSKETDAQLLNKVYNNPSSEGLHRAIEFEFKLRQSKLQAKMAEDAERALNAQVEIGRRQSHYSVQQTELLRKQLRLNAKQIWIMISVPILALAFEIYKYNYPRDSNVCVPQPVTVGTK